TAGLFLRRPLRAFTVAGQGDGGTDRILQVRIALEAQFLAELDHAGLADIQRVGQLLRGVVAQQVGDVEDEVGDAAFDGRHLFAFGADFYQRWHGRQVGCDGVTLGRFCGSGKGLFPVCVIAAQAKGASLLLLPEAVALDAPAVERVASGRVSFGWLFFAWAKKSSSLPEGE